jgi:uncharacterized protein YgbK (DUF1537 family)
VERLKLYDLIKGLPSGNEKDPGRDIQRFTLKNEITTIVLDDDPTGTQTVHNVPVLTQWTHALIEDELINKTPVFYILTNSRSLNSASAEKLNAELGEMICHASGKTGRKVRVISRSDSTLRGHYPAEVIALKKALCLEESTDIIIPAFYQGGRYTIEDIHYVEEDEILIPAAETPFAKDKTFGYRSSNLKEWIIEKTENSITMDQIGSVSLSEIRKFDIDAILKTLEDPGYKAIVVNAVTENDLKVVATALLMAEDNGKKFLYRTAASIVPVITGIENKPVMKKDDFDLDTSAGGLIVVGSYVPKSTAQLEFLLKNDKIRSVELNAEEIIYGKDQLKSQDSMARQISKMIASGENVVLYTSRKLVTGKESEESLKINNKVARALNYVINKISVRPSFVIAKGGITSSDIATECFKVSRALVLGQIIPGVPVWKLDGKWEGLTYIVFPGNVGKENSLSQVFETLSGLKKA